MSSRRATSGSGPVSGNDTASLTDGYQPVDGVYDEMVDRAGGIRPHWDPVIGQLDSMRRPDAQIM